jgi:arsenate reductase
MPANNVVMYGITNCSTIKKARDWLQQNNIDYQFHDYKKKGTDAEQLKQWIDQLGWEQLINRRGTTWRKLDANTRESMNNTVAISVMQDNPSIIKRPLLEVNAKLVLGFDENLYQQEFHSS